MNNEQEKLVMENLPLMRAVVKRCFKPNSSIGGLGYNDLLQTAREGLCIAALHYKGQTPFAAYAWTVARNKLYGYCRAIRRQTGGLTVLPETVEDSADNLREAEVIGLLEEFADEYTGVARKGVQALILIVHGYTTREAATALGTNSKTAAAWISRAKDKLRSDSRFLDAIR